MWLMNSAFLSSAQWIHVILLFTRQKKLKLKKKKDKKRIVEPNTHLLFHFYLLKGQFSSIRNIITSNKLVGGFVTLMLR